MLICKPLPLLEAHLFLRLRVNGLTTEKFHETILNRYPNNRSEYEHIFEAILALEERLIAAVTVDDDVLQSLYSPLSIGVRRNGNVAQDGVADMIVSDMNSFTRSAEGVEPFFKYLRSDSNNILRNIAAAIASDPADASCIDAASLDTNALFQLVNECSWPQSAKFTLLDVAINSEKYIERLEETLCPVAAEFCRCESIWAPLIELCEQTYSKYDTVEAMVRADFPHVPCNFFSAFTAYPSITGYRQVFLADKRSDSDNPPEFTIICGIMFDMLQRISSLEQNSIAELSRIMSVLGDPSRFNIVVQLSKRPSCGRELSKLLSLTPGAISQHISILMGTGLVTSTVEGNRIYYALSKQKMKEFMDTMLNTFPC